MLLPQEGDIVVSFFSSYCAVGCFFIIFAEDRQCVGKEKMKIHFALRSICTIFAKDILHFGTENELMCSFLRPVAVPLIVIMRIMRNFMGVFQRFCGIVYIGAFILLMVGVAACTNKEKQPDKKSDTSQYEGQMLKVAVIPTTDCMPLFVAKERGFFDSLAVHVDLVCKQSQMDCDQAILKGEAEMMVSDLMRTERLIRKGTPLTYISSTNAYWQLIGNRLSRVKKIDHLSDKLMGMARYSATDYLGTLAVDSVKPRYPVFRIQVNDVDVRLRMLTNNEIDAVLLTEPQATVARMQHHPVLFDSRHKDIALGVLAVKSSVMNDKQKKEMVDNFVAAYNIACDSINERGIGAYSDLLRKYCHIDDATIGELPKLNFRHAEKPRQKDIDRTVNVKWKTF